MNTMRALKDLPSDDGFEFVGIGLNGERWPCIVRAPYSVHRQDNGQACWFDLYAWESQPDNGNGSES